ncbi:universal stress protein [Aquihabitans sp. G128]|uniref:universal stress protein n=1 Tax=Aquihabitans sp. G128 TaxID=2849779 RepID=UPI001C213E8E|nr:universal stress protein [Aquihabitans sp. G128]QXC61100.1 universal stress protein [Aquihabitans sp. G128]
MKVMIATDGSVAAVAAARRAVALLHPDAHVALVTVIEARHDADEDAGGFEGPLQTQEEADEEWNEALAAGRAALARTGQAIGGADEQRLVPSSAGTADALLAVMEQEQPDVVVLGSEQPGWFDRLLHGSVEDRLLHRAPCPLLVVNHRSAGSA